MGVHRITIYPEKKTILASEKDNLLEILLKNGFFLDTVCGGDGICGKCKVVIRRGEVEAKPTSFLTHGEIQRHYVLACEAYVRSDLVIYIPPESRLSSAEAAVLAGKIPHLYSKAEPVEKQDELELLEEHQFFVHGPLSTKLFLKLPPPTLEDNISDLERVYREIRKNRNIPIMQTGLVNIKRLGELLRNNNWEITVTLGKRNGTVEIVQIEPGNTAEENFGVAIDIGTTTIVAHLVDLKTEETLGAEAIHNQQATFGTDIISRIIYAGQKGGLEKLHQAVIENINALIHSLISKSKVKLHDVNGIMCAGNMTMTHLVLGVDPTYLRKEPYVPTANFVPTIRAAEVGIKIDPRGLLACLPGVSSYIGGDITGGVLACGMNKKEEICALIDIGTNGEIALGNKEWLICCSSSAGPAFEGSGVTCGMKATQGAIQRVEINEDFQISYQTVGQQPPAGICGSGYIDLLAEMFKRKIITRAGKFKTELNLPHLRKGKEGWELVVVRGEETASGKDIVITETDITNLIRSKGAVFAGTKVLLQHVGLEMSDISRFYVAGGFGTYLNIEKAITIGLLPDLPTGKYRFIGNSSVTGAKMALLSYQAFSEAQEIARKMTCFELSVDHTFMDEYISSLFLPHTNLELFPRVKKILEGGKICRTENSIGF